jgi:ATP-binding cassette, subfamily F, member 3
MIDLINLSLQFGGKYLFKDLNLKISSGDRYALVGANGSGKSSLLKIISGQLEPESGSVNKQKRISIGYLPQEQIIHEGRKLKDETFSALDNIVDLQNKVVEIREALAIQTNNTEMENELLIQLGEAQSKLEELDPYSASSKVEKILIGLGFSESEFEKKTNEFSGGWQMRIALAKLLVAQNDILLLDEPTNHLDLDSLEWLIEFIKNFKGALVIVSHDKHFVEKTTQKTLEFFLGKLNIYNGKLSSFLNYKIERDELLVNQYENQQKKLKETQKFIERFRYKATKARQVQSRIKQLEKVELIELPDSEKKIDIRFSPPPQSGKINIELIGISKSYGSNHVFSQVEITIKRGDKIAFVGPNGAGKSTLSKIIADKIDFDSGEKVVGHNTLVSYYSQDAADNLDPSLDIIESVSGINEEKTLGQLRSLLGSFLFTGDDVFKKVGVLSGGEKSRLALCRILLTKTNLVVLDEPTNHLDYNSKKVLQSALINFSGSLVIVSHDVEFLEPVANRVVEVRNHKIKIYDGGIDYYLSKREEFLNAENNPSPKSSESASVNRRDQKRFEAEQRQKKYAATKDLKKKVEGAEQKIHSLEKEEMEIEEKLYSPEIYGNNELVLGLNERLTKIKEELKEQMKIWEKFSTELHYVEMQFD